MRISYVELLFLCALFTLKISIPNVSHAADQSSPLELSHVLEHVYNTNPSLMAARENFRATQELYPQARAGWLPSISAEASLFASDVENSNFSNGDGATTKDLSVNIDQPIWRGGKTFAESARAKDLISAADASLKQIEQDIFLQSITLYLNLIREAELVRLREQNEDILDKEFKAAKERKKMGDATATDVQQAKSRASRAKSERIEAQRNYDITMAEFEEITAMDGADDIRTVSLDLDIPDTIEEILSLAEKFSPEIQRAEFEHLAAQHQSDANFRELLPQISAFASYNRQLDPQPGIVSESNTETIGIRATLLLYDGGATISRISEAKSSEKSQEYLIEEVKRRVKQQVKSNWRSYQTAQIITQSRAEEITAAKNALKGVREEAKVGQRTMMDILDADQELIDAQVEHTQAERDEHLARFALAKNLGLLNAEMIFSME